MQSLAFADASVQSPATTQPAVAYRHAPAIGPAAIIPLAGEINDYNRDALFRRFATARNLGAKTVILDISTYGGSLPPALDISNFIKRQDDLHVIAFVRDKAISAGALIAVACDEIVMAPHATIGDCAPIIFDIGGELKPLPLAERAKQEGPSSPNFLKVPTAMDTIGFCLNQWFGFRPPSTTYRTIAATSDLSMSKVTRSLRPAESGSRSLACPVRWMAPRRC